jgi:hypothetical protein
MTKYLAFDIETRKIIPDGSSNLYAYRPLGITCAALLPSDTKKVDVFYGVDSKGCINDQMSSKEAANLVKSLTKKVEEGYRILTWNGLGFDFDILAEESGLFDECRRLAIDHVDMMFHVFCELGYGVSLDRAAKAIGLSGKTEGMNGALAPRLWAEGRQQDVIHYVIQDVRTTLELALVCENQRRLRWITQRGKIGELPLHEGWLSVRNAMNLPEPDTSWMTNPWSRKKFLGWLFA